MRSIRLPAILTMHPAVRFPIATRSAEMHTEARAQDACRTRKRHVGRSGRTALHETSGFPPRAGSMDAVPGRAVTDRSCIAATRLSKEGVHRLQRGRPPAIATHDRAVRHGSSAIVVAPGDPVAMPTHCACCPVQRRRASGCKMCGSSPPDPRHGDRGGKGLWPRYVRCRGKPRDRIGTGLFEISSRLECWNSGFFHGKQPGCPGTEASEGAATWVSPSGTSRRSAATSSSSTSPAASATRS